MSDTPETPTEKPKNEGAYFLSLTVENFRCFGVEQHFDLQDYNGNPHMWNVILGENGVGKTTLLTLFRSVEFDHPSEGSNFPIWKISQKHENWVANRKNFDFEFDYDNIDSFLNRYLKNRFPTGDLFIGGFCTRISLDFDKWTEFIYGRGVLSVYKIIPGKETMNGKLLFICDYSASRLMDDKALSDIDKDEISLINPLKSLPNAEDWLVQADYAVLRNSENEVAKKRFNLVKSILKELLPDVEDFRFQTVENTSMTPLVEAKTPYGWVRVRELSLGYQTTLAWIVDFASKLMDRYPESDNPFAEPAICLVDEIDLHMHPRWQKELVQKLRKLFPKTQFIVTAHSPLIVQADPDANIALLRRNGDHVEIVNDVDHIKNWRVEQILASELFAGAGAEYMDLVNPPHIAKLLDRRRAILGQAKLSKADEAEVAEIDAKLSMLPSAERPEDQKALDLIHKAAARLGDTTEK